MTKADLITVMASKTGLMKTECEKVLNAFTSNITKSLTSGDDVKLIGFGTFSVKDRSARTGRNPSTGAEIQIPASKVAGFKAGKEFKEALNN